MICKVCSIFGHQYSLVFYHNLYSLVYIWPSEQSGLLSQSVQSGLYLAISTVWSSITICTVCPIFGHQYSLVFYHNLYSPSFIWPSVKYGLLSHFVQSGLYLAISTFWSSITICTVCHIFDHQNSLVFYHNLYSPSYIWPSVQSGLPSQSVQSALYLAISTVSSSITIGTVHTLFGHQYSLLYSLPSEQSGLLSQYVQPVLYLAIRTVWSFITICTARPMFGHQNSLVFYHNLYSRPKFGHQYSLVFYHNLYSLSYIWPSVQSGLLSQSVQSGLHLAISTVWPSITICTVCPILGNQYSLIFFHNLYSPSFIWPSVQSAL